MTGFIENVAEHVMNAQLKEKDGFYGVSKLADAESKDAAKDLLADI
jgi:hypothetical protein